MKQILPLALLQGGLANQLLQVALVTHIEQITFHELSVSDCLFSSRLRRLRSVTQRRLSHVFDTQLLDIPRYQELFSRFCFRLPSFAESLHDGAIFRIEHNRLRIYRGDGLTPTVFSPEYNKYWFSIINYLDRRFGACKYAPKLAIHVRRGDYAASKTQRGSGLYPLPVGYYLNAISLLKCSEVDSTPIFFFSDFPGQVLKEFGPCLTSPFQIIDGGSPEEDLWRMSFSPNLILSNSSFSCVAAHLSKLRNTRVKVVAPSRWFLRDGIPPRLDLRQPDWIQA